MKTAKARLARFSSGDAPSEIRSASRFSFDAYFAQRAALVERELARRVIAIDGPAIRLFEAMRYSLLAPSKRLRPILALASCESVGGDIKSAMGFACAVEMIHTYSLIHDDLPCMDDDDLRRGRPTNHKVYGEAVAVLAGDALLTDAFRMAASSGAPAEARVDAIAELSAAAGSQGMVAGQIIDLLSEGQTLNVEQLEYLHSRKTGALFVASVRGGARIGGADKVQLGALESYARALGLAFQVVDDLLDVESSPEQMGKHTQKDAARGKNTYPALIGIEQSRELARTLEKRAHRALVGFDSRADALRQLATFAVERKL